MKIILIENNQYNQGGEEDLSWDFLPDSAYSNSGKPFFIPEGYSKASVSLTPAIKISRLGKTIEKKFAHRYYGHFLPAVHFTLPALEKNLSSKNLSTAPAISFDKSFFCGDEECRKTDSMSFELWKNNEKVTEWKLSNLHYDPDEVIAWVSKMNTLKIGDLILPGESAPVDIKEGDKIEVRYNTESVLTIKIK